MYNINAINSILTPNVNNHTIDPCRHQSPRRELECIIIGTVYLEAVRAGVKVMREARQCMLVVSDRPHS